MNTGTKYQKDLTFVQNILKGEAKAWNRFVQKYSDKICTRAWQLCNEFCHNTQGVLYCVFKGLAAGGVQLDKTGRAGCDEGLEIYAFTFDYFFNRKQNTGKLKFYDGRSQLDTFVTAVLFGNLRTDWIRHKRHLRVDQITRPPEIKKLCVTDQKIFDQMVMQRNAETIARYLRLSIEQVEQAQSRISHELMANDHLHLILRSPEQPLEENFSRADTASPHIIPMRRALNQLWDKICFLIGELPEHEKILMDMYFDKELDAETILSYCKELHLKLPVVPRNGRLNIHNVYQSIDLILKKLGKLLHQKYAKELENCYNLMENESNFVSKEISIKGLKLLLKNMGLKTEISSKLNNKEGKNVRLIQK